MADLDRVIPRETLVRMVEIIDSEWTVREAKLAESGYTSVYYLTIETQAQQRECVLKATPDGNHHGIDTEARLLTILRSETSIPVPKVLGAVDAHDGVPTPFFLMEAVPGTSVSRRNIDRLSETTIKHIVRSVGEHLGELHALDAVDGFGELTCDRTRTLRGNPPSASTDQVAVSDATRSWPTLVRTWAEAALDQQSSGRFADVTPRIRPAIHERIDGLSGPFRPVIGHTDQEFDNVFFDADSGEVTAIIDWAFALAVTPAYDLVCAEWSLSGGVGSLLPSTLDCRHLVRQSLTDGYRRTARQADLDRFYQHRTLYESLALLESMNNLEDWLADAPDDQIDRAAERARTRIDDLLF